MNKFLCASNGSVCLNGGRITLATTRVVVINGSSRFCSNATRILTDEAFLAGKIDYLMYWNAGKNIGEEKMEVVISYNARAGKVYELKEEEERTKEWKTKKSKLSK